MRARNLSIALVIFAVAAGFGLEAVHKSNLSSETEIAARYHLRKRTSNFFERSNPSKVGRVANTGRRRA